MRKITWLVISTLMVLSLVIAACGQTSSTSTQTTTAPATSTSTAISTSKTTTTSVPISTTTTGALVPKYGGTITRVLNVEPSTTIGPFPGQGATPQQFQELWAGDWTRGNAGGYGTKETDWSQTVDRFDRKVGLIAEKTTWTFDVAKDQGTIVYKIRQGIHYGLNPASEASRLVNGRELTADDVVFVINKRYTDIDSYVWRTNPELRTTNVSKTGPWEVTVNVNASTLLTALNRYSSTTGYYPPEVFTKYNKMINWKDQVGTSAFMLTDYVPGSQRVFTRNPNYWEKDPIGPGKGNQLPYVDMIRELIIPDASTRLAALRTGKIDSMLNLLSTDAEPLIKQVPALKVLEKTSVDGRGTPAFPRTDQAPFNDVRVRRAMFMSIDFDTILKNYWNGKGQILTYPFADMIDYHDLYLGINDPDTPASVKELFTYNPDKAKALLKEAGFPNGFKTSILLSGQIQSDVDYYSIIKDMWGKAGIDLSLDLAEAGPFASRQAARSYVMTNGTTAPAATFYLGVAYIGAGGNANLGNLNDPVVNQALTDVRVQALTDLPKAMQLWREKLAKYVLDQAYAIPNVIGYNYNMWWPWLRNYSGEGPVSYAQTIWMNYVWFDSDLKKSMGH